MIRLFDAIIDLVPIYVHSHTVKRLTKGARMKYPVWLRLFFLFVLAQALLVGSAILQPSLITLVLPWDASPLNTRFIAALYLMGAISALLCMVATSYTEVRLSLIEIGIVTGMLLLLTVPHFGEFNATTFPYRWTIFYTIDPLVTGLILWRMRKHNPVSVGRNVLAPLFTVYAALLAIIGAVLLVAPTVAAQLWPWALPPILGQVYSVFFLTFAVGGWLAAREPGWGGVRIYVLANVGMLLLIVGVSLWHSDRFKPGLTTWVWYACCLASIGAFGAALWRRPDQRAVKGVMS